MISYIENSSDVFGNIPKLEYIESDSEGEGSEDVDGEEVVEGEDAKEELKNDNDPEEAEKVKVSDEPKIEEEV